MAIKSVIKLRHIVDFFEDEAMKLVSKGENAFESQHVSEIVFDGDVRYLKGKVQASMRQKVFYDVQIDLNDNATIKSAKCTCIRGQVRCHHMAAVLIHAHHHISVTDKSCGWKKSKEATEEKVVTIDEMFTSTEKQNYRATVTQPDGLRERLYHQLREAFGHHVAFCWFLSPDAAAPEELHNLESVLRSEEFQNCPDKIKFLQERVRVCAEQISMIERNTIGQSKNYLWLITRRFLLTASCFGAVLKALRLGSYPKSLFKRIFSSYDLSGVRAVQYGVDNEGEARRLFEEAFGVKVKSCGLYVHESGLLGASPDGIIDDDNLLEIKCPWSMRERDVEEELKKRNDYIVKYNGETLQINYDHEYYHQIQGQMFLANRKCCYVVIWSAKGFVSVPVKRDEAWAANVPLLLDFFFTHLLPVILKEMI